MLFRSAESSTVAMGLDTTQILASNASRGSWVDLPLCLLDAPFAIVADKSEGENHMQKGPIIHLGAAAIANQVNQQYSNRKLSKREATAIAILAKTDILQNQSKTGGRWSASKVTTKGEHNLLRTLKFFHAHHQPSQTLTKENRQTTASKINEVSTDFDHA